MILLNSPGSSDKTLMSDIFSSSSCGATEAEAQTGLSDLMTDRLTFSRSPQFYSSNCLTNNCRKLKCSQKKGGAVCILPAFTNQKSAALQLLNLIHTSKLN